MANRFLQLLQDAGVLLGKTINPSLQQQEFERLRQQQQAQAPGVSLTARPATKDYTTYTQQWPIPPTQQPTSNNPQTDLLMKNAAVQNQVNQPIQIPLPTPTPSPQVYAYGKKQDFDWKGAVKPEVESAIIEASNQYQVPKELLYDIAASESSLDPKSVNTTPAGQKAGNPTGLFQFTDNTWEQVKKYAKQKDSTLKLPNYDRTDPKTNALAAAYLISKGQLGKWYASEWNWGKNWTPKELEDRGYYEQTLDYVKGKRYSELKTEPVPSPLSFLFPQAQAATADNLPVQTIPSFLEELIPNLKETARQIPQAAQTLGTTAQNILQPLRYENVAPAWMQKILPRKQDDIRYETLQNSTNLTNAEKQWMKDYEQKRTQDWALIASTSPQALGGKNAVLNAEAAKDAQRLVGNDELVKLRQAGYPQMQDELDELITPEYGKRLTPDERVALKMRLGGAGQDEIINATNPDAYSKVMRRLEGEGYIPDFENALNAKDKAGASQAIQEMYDLGDKQNAESSVNMFKRIFEPQPIKNIQFKPSEVIADKATPKLDIKTFLDTYNKSGGVTSTGIIPEAERIAMEKLAPGNIQQWELVEAGMPKSAVAHAQLRLEGQGAKVDLLLARKSGNPKLIEKLEEVNKQIGDKLIKQKFERVTVADIPKELNSLVDLAKRSKSADDFIDTIAMSKNQLLEKYLNINPITKELIQVQNAGFRSLTDFFNLITQK